MTTLLKLPAPAVRLRIDSPLSVERHIWSPINGIGDHLINQNKTQRQLEIQTALWVIKIGISTLERQR